MAAFAIEEGDLERGNHLNCTTINRTPATLALRRQNTIRAEQLPLELIDDQAHHQQFFLTLARQPPKPQNHAVNRQKMLDEVARLLD
jgi:hypothetical protein